MTYDPNQPTGQQFPSQAPYGQPPVRQTNVMAIIALVASFFFWPAGLVCGIIAKNQIKQTGEDGEGLAKAGIIISAVQAVLTVMVIILVILAFAIPTTGMLVSQ